jgi:FkbM family methyltransferase
MSVISKLFLFFICFFCFTNEINAQYYAQNKQDRYLNDTFFKDKKNGVFIEAGAYDGVTGSNTLFFEKNHGWKGLCIEPMPEHYKNCTKKRNCICILGCLANAKKHADFLQISLDHKTSGVKAEYVEGLSGILENFSSIQSNRINSFVSEYNATTNVFKTPCYLLNDLLEEYGLFEIDLFSLDTEGGELEILKSIDYNRFIIDVILVENNWFDPDFRTFMESVGYEYIKRIVNDEVYKRKT